MSVNQLQTLMKEYQGFGSEDRGNLSPGEISKLYAAAIKLAPGELQGQTVEAGEADFFGSIPKSIVGRGAEQRLSQAKLDLAAMLAPPARSAATRQKLISQDPFAAVRPRNFKRNPMVEKALAGMLTAGGAAFSRMVPANFEIGGAAPNLGNWSRINDNVTRYTDKVGIVELTKVPADGVLDFTLLVKPSGHHDLNRHSFARTNEYRAIFKFTRKGAGRGGRDNMTMYRVRNQPKGERRWSDNKAVGGEEYGTVLDFSIDLKKFSPGDEIFIDLAPYPSGSGGWYHQRTFKIVVPDLSTLPKF